MSLRLAHSAYTICWPWHLWFLAANDGHPRGGQCVRCERSIAVPRRAEARGLCLYCALDLGLADPIDVPIGRVGA